MRAVLMVLMLIGGESETKAYTLIGAGESSCGAWTEYRRSPGTTKALMDISWVTGFLSGVGAVGNDGADPLDGVDKDGLSGWIDNYCQSNPIERIYQAAKAFYYAHPHH